MQNKTNQTFLLIKFGLFDKFKSLLVWSGIWILLALILSNLFNSFAEQDELEIVLKTLPKELLAAMNISSGYFSKVENFVSGEFLTLYTLMGSIFAVFLGVGAIGGRLENGQITSQLNQNLSRFQIIFSQIIINLIFLVKSGLLIGFFAYFAFSFFTGQQVSSKYFIMAMLGSFGLQFLGLALGFLLGLFFTKSTAQSVGGGLIAASWLFNGLKDTAGYPEEIKPLSVFYYFDIELLRAEFTLNWTYFSILIAISSLLLIFSVWKFKNSEVYV
jgi:ABC-type transport system involved in multi-copper enzyme maturation permease subunit